MRGLRRRLSDDLSAIGMPDGEHGDGALPPATKQKPSGMEHAPTAPTGVPTPKVPSLAPEAVAAKAGGAKSGGVDATLAHPPLEASEDEAGSEETFGKGEPDED